VPLPPVREAPRNRLEMAHDAGCLRTRQAVLAFLFSKHKHVEAPAA
jgi:nitrate/nitrite transport system ATP-binding protein